MLATNWMTSASCIGHTTSSWSSSMIGAIVVFVVEFAVVAMVGDDGVHGVRVGFTVVVVVGRTGSSKWQSTCAGRSQMRSFGLNHKPCGQYAPTLDPFLQLKKYLHPFGLTTNVSTGNPWHGSVLDRRQVTAATTTHTNKITVKLNRKWISRNMRNGERRTNLWRASFLEHRLPV